MSSNGSKDSDMSDRPSFEGSYRGDSARISDATRLECKICWWVYDPSEGDPVWQIEPGTPFSALPDHWCCPNCDGAAEQFMVLNDAV
jgi:rubredoxin